MEKRLRPRKEATIEQKESFLQTLQYYVENFEDDRFQSEFGSLIEDMAKENDICIHCFTQVQEAWTNEGLVRSCGCKSKLLSA